MKSRNIQTSALQLYLEAKWLSFYDSCAKSDCWAVCTWCYHITLIEIFTDNENCRRLRVKLYVMTCSHWLSASNRFITPYAHCAFYNIFCSFLQWSTTERWYYRWLCTRSLSTHFPFQMSPYHYKLQHDFTVQVETRSDVPLELIVQNTEWKIKNTWGFLLTT